MSAPSTRPRVESSFLVKLKREYRDGEVSGIKVLEAPEIGQAQHFTPRLLVGAEWEGWLEADENEIRILSEPPLVFRILAEPGTFPDDSERAGYRVDNFYRCERIG